jgi:hypothetical protein
MVNFRQHLETLRERFTAMNLSSRTLRLSRCTRSGALDLARVETLLPEAFDDLTDRLGHGRDGDMALVPQQAADPDVNRLTNDVRVLATHARSDWLETGLRDLAIGWPFLEGKGLDGTWIRAPLFLYPVWLERTSKGRLEWRLDMGEPPTLNDSLVLTLARIAGVCLTLDDLLKEDDDRVFAYDNPTWVGMLRCLRGLGLSMDGPEDLPALEPVVTRTKDDRDNASSGKFTLRNHLVLGRFPPSGSSLVGDYDTILDNPDLNLGLGEELLAVDLTTAAGLNHLAPTTSAGAFSGVQQYLALASDSSQDDVLRWLQHEDSTGVVVQGPPGTGKSQLITNLVTAAIALGWRVLVVCEKRAALDVVEDRMVRIGLGEPLALVHDVTSDRNAVCNGIVRTLEAVSDTARKEPVTTHRARLEQALTRARTRAEIGQTAWRQLTEQPHGRPALATLFERALSDEAGVLPEIAQWVESTSEGELTATIPHIEAVSTETEALAAPHPLAVREDFSGLSDPDLVRTRDSLHLGLEILEEIASASGLMTPAEVLKRDDVWRAAAPALDLFDAPDAEDLHRFLLFWSWTGGQSAHGAWQTVMERLLTAKKELQEVPYELVVTPDETLECWAREIDELERLRTLWYRPFLPSFWRLRLTPEKVMDRCPSLGGRSQALVLRDASQNVRRLCEQARAWSQLIHDIPQDNPFLDFGFQGDPADITGAIDDIRGQYRRVDAVHKLHASLQDLGGPYAALPSFDGALSPRDEPLIAAAMADRRSGVRYRELRDLVESLRSWMDAGLVGVLDRALVTAAGGQAATGATQLRTLLAAWEDAGEARRLDELTQDLPGWARAFLRQWRRSPRSGASPGDDAETTLNRAWRTVALAGRSRSVIEAPLVVDEQLDALSDDIAACREVAAAGVRGVFQDRAADRVQANGKAMRQLAAEARKRRRRLTLRQLIERFWDAGLAQVRPVWLCSPDSVASMFPLRNNLFDLVVFDEASQCPVEAALPVLMRGKRALIAGDDQQMPPSTFFRAAHGIDPEDDNSTLLASESLLELARVAFPALTLRWHYRSRHESLVAFSNAAFYRGELYTAPRPEKRMASPIEGLHYIPVAGLWQEQCNLVEANRVVELIAELLASDTAEGHTPTIGVVTFNLTQAALIQERVAARYVEDPRFRALMAKDQLRLPIDQVFIRNLENVQGDERDVIIFSMGYGRNEEGGRVHARFGPVGQQGGEKRLNVAITRARLGIYLVTSFDPDELDVSRTRHPGPKLLMQYARYVRAVSEGRHDEVIPILRRAAALNNQSEHTHTVMGANARLVGLTVRRQLARDLEDRGLEVELQFGVGRKRLDLVVSRPGSASRIGVDCGAFLDIQPPLSRDVYSRGYWSRLGWNVIRVTPGMWLEQREAVITQILAAV